MPREKLNVEDKLRAEAIFDAHQLRLYKRTDRLFAGSRVTEC